MPLTKYHLSLKTIGSIYENNKTPREKEFLSTYIKGKKLVCIIRETQIRSYLIIENIII